MWCYTPVTRLGGPALSDHVIHVVLHTSYSTWGTRPIWWCHSCQLLDLGDHPIWSCHSCGVTVHTSYSTWGTRPIWSCHSCGVTHQLLNLGDPPYLIMSFMSYSTWGTRPIWSCHSCGVRHQLLDLGDPPYLIMSFMWCNTPVTQLGGPALSDHVIRVV